MNFGQIFLVVNIGLIASILNVLHVIIGNAKTIPGQVYMATGHYYLDYFEYLQALSQGWHGHWFWENYFGTDKIKTIDGMWQYLILGKIGRLFGFSQITTYWIFVVFFSLVLSILIFYIIRKLLANQPFYKQFIAYIFVLFATPFFNQKIILYRFWNDNAVITSRFGGIPYHITSQITALLIMMLMAQTLDKFLSSSRKIIALKTFFIISLSTFLVSFSPSYFLLITLATILTLIWFAMLKKPFNQIKFLIIILMFLFPIGYVFKYYLFRQFLEVTLLETAWQVHPPLVDVLLTFGPLTIFFWTGIKNYFRNFSTIRIIFFNFVIVSYSLFFSPLAVFLGTTNTRFLTPLHYVLLSVMTVMGIKKFRYLLIITICFFLVFVPANIKNVSDQLNDQNLFSPITYLPKGIVDGLVFLNKVPGKAVLTTPAQFLGAIASIYSNKSTFLPPPGILNFGKKADIANRFYLGLMGKKEAYDFLNKNEIDFIVLTSIENYPLEKLRQYDFLKQIYQNQDIVIFQLKKIPVTSSVKY